MNAIENKTKLVHSSMKQRPNDTQPSFIPISEYTGGCWKISKNRENNTKIHVDETKARENVESVSIDKLRTSFSSFFLSFSISSLNNDK